jgi:hypothetical protein
MKDHYVRDSKTGCFCQMKNGCKGLYIYSLISSATLKTVTLSGKRPLPDANCAALGHTKFRILNLTCIRVGNQAAASRRSWKIRRKQTAIVNAVV